MNNARRLDATEKRHEVMGPWDLRPPPPYKSQPVKARSPRKPFSGRCRHVEEDAREPGVKAAQ